MSAPPPGGHPNGQVRPPPPKGPNPMRRKPRADPLVARKRPNPNAQKSKPKLESAFSQAAPKHAGTLARSLLTEKDDEKALEKMKQFEQQRSKNGGWTQAMDPNIQYRDFPLVTTKRELKEGMRLHIMRFAKAAQGGEHNRIIDPTDQSDFTRPVSLHRRDPRQPPAGRAVKERTPTPPPADDAEAQRIAQMKAERAAQRAIDLAQIAPSVKDPSTKKAATTQKKENPINSYYGKQSDEHKKQQEVRYEEALPWLLEDADGKNVWQGTYVSALSETNVAFVIHEGSFRMVPLEKFYRFSHKPNIPQRNLDEVEQIMNKKVAPPRWALADMDKEKKEQELADTRRTLNGRVRVKMESSTYRSAPKSEKYDQDDIDMEGDEFQDDDENVGLEPENDEDSKDTRERMRRDHLGANNFGEGDERELERQKELEEKEEKERNELGKQVRKALKNREFHLEYESDSDSDPFADSSSEEEKDEPEEKKEGEDGKEKADGKDKSAPGSTAKSAPSSQSKSKLGEADKKSKKRPGSPNLSESSGNESSRKKAKKQKQAPGASNLGSRAGTPVPSRPKVANKGGALSDGEATAGEMSDGGVAKPKKIKLVGSGAKGTPLGSRAGSPVPTQAQQGSASGNASPQRAGTAAASPGSPITHRPVEAWEITEALRGKEDGMTIGDLLRVFGRRVGESPGQQPRKDWIKLVKQNAVVGPDKKLRAKS